MNANLADDLRQHLKLCHEVLDLAQRENHSLREPGQTAPFEACQTRKHLLPQLGASLDTLRRQRGLWQRLSPAERGQQPEVPSLMRQNQDLIMRILVLDRENEQFLLRRGLIPPRHLPPASSQRPHFVADLYRRNCLSSGDAD